MGEIHIGHFCLSGPPAGRFSAAARAGFTGISLLWDEVAQYRKSEGCLSGLKTQLSEAAIRATVLECVALTAAEDCRAFGEKAQIAAECAAELGCGMIHTYAAGLNGTSTQIVEQARLLAEACAAAGIGAVLEFVPFVSGVQNLRTALAIVRSVDHAALGLMIDSLHFFRSGAPWADLASVLPHEIKSIQVNDGPLVRPTDDYAEECMYRRRLPGDGEFDLDRFVAILDTANPCLPLMAEVVNRELLGLPASEAASIIARRTRALDQKRNIR